MLCAPRCAVRFPGAPHWNMGIFGGVTGAAAAGALSARAAPPVYVPFRFYPRRVAMSMPKIMQAALTKCTGRTGSPSRIRASAPEKAGRER